MNHRQIIAGFSDLLTNENFDSQAIQDLSQLSQTLEKLENDQSDAIADAIVDWCVNHQPLGESLRIVALRWKPRRANKANEEKIRDNISLKNQIRSIAKETETQVVKSEISQNNNNNN